jgi:hypothetical protein
MLVRMVRRLGGMMVEWEREEFGVGSWLTRQVSGT